MSKLWNTYLNNEININNDKYVNDIDILLQIKENRQKMYEM
jgi:hypothetical protein